MAWLRTLLVAAAVAVAAAEKGDLYGKDGKEKNSLVEQVPLSRGAESSGRAERGTAGRDADTVGAREQSAHARGCGPAHGSFESTLALLWAPVSPASPAPDRHPAWHCACKSRHLHVHGKRVAHACATRARPARDARKMAISGS